MKTMVIKRTDSDSKRTLSECKIIEDGVILLEFKGIELPWKENQRNISCIPQGDYSGIAVRRKSNAAYALHIINVPDRSEIMVHTANFVRQLRGCLAPGTEFLDIDKDGIMDITNSRRVMNQIEEIIPLWSKFEYIVTRSNHHVNEIG